MMDNGAHPGLLCKQRVHILVTDGRHEFDILVIPGEIRIIDITSWLLDGSDGWLLKALGEHSPLHPFLVFRDILGIEQFARGRILAQLMLAHTAAVHEDLSNHGKT